MIEMLLRLYSTMNASIPAEITSTSTTMSRLFIMFATWLCKSLTNDTPVTPSMESRVRPSASSSVLSVRRNTVL